MDVGNDGPLVVNELIEEGALAYVCLADDGDGYALLEGLSRFKGLCEIGDAGFYLLGECEEFGAVGKFEVFVVGEVEFELKEGSVRRRSVRVADSWRCRGWHDWWRQ